MKKNTKKNLSTLINYSYYNNFQNLKKVSLTSKIFKKISNIKINNSKTKKTNCYSIHP